MKNIRRLIEIALKEDIGNGDKTTIATIPEGKGAKAVIKAKEEGVICGLMVAKEVFHALDKKISFNITVKDGSKVSKGDVIAEIEGNARNLLTGERVALNFMQRLSGIATLTSLFVGKCKNAKILDTRKTTPGLRSLEKYAVRCGGGLNHRMGLYDMIMIKDNHIEAAGSITAAIRLARKEYPKLKIEVETRNLNEVEEAVKNKADRIMLDNMGIEEMKKAVKIINKKAEVEASGNISLDNIEEVDSTGVDFISVGKLTHSAKALDISMKIIK